MPLCLVQIDMSLEDDPGEIIPDNFIERFASLIKLDPWECIDGPVRAPYQKNHMYGFQDSDFAIAWWISDYPVCPQIGWELYAPNGNPLGFEERAVTQIQMFCDCPFLLVTL